MQDYRRLQAWLSFLQTEGIGSVYSQRLLELFGEPQNFMGEELTMTDLPKKILNGIYLNAMPLHWDKTVKLMEEKKIFYTTILDDDYPEPLKEIYSPPLILFYRGKLPLRRLHSTLAVVGTRRADNYGRYICSKLSRELAAKGVIIVSGLAYGIDTIAHKSTLDVGGTTLAVMATGCDQIYPPENTKMAEAIIEKGAILSEYQPGIAAQRYYFPQRNRIISGLSRGTLVVQGKQNSGAMLTAKFANDQGKEIFAVPGNINNQLSEGPNYLIKNGATVVTKMEDIFETYANGGYVEQLTIFPELNKVESAIYEYLKSEDRPVHLDEIFIKMRMNISKLSMILMNLELKGVVKSLPGNKYIYLY